MHTYGENMARFVALDSRFEAHATRPTSSSFSCQATDYQSRICVTVGHSAGIARGMSYPVTVSAVPQRSHEARKQSDGTQSLFAERTFGLVISATDKTTGMDNLVCNRLFTNFESKALPRMNDN